MFLCLGPGVLHVLARREAMDLQLFFGQFVGRGLLSWLWVFLGLMQQSDRDDEDECCYGTGFVLKHVPIWDDVVIPFSLIHGTVSLGTCKACHSLRGSAERRNKGNRSSNERRGKLGRFEWFP